VRHGGGGRPPVRAAALARDEEPHLDSRVRLAQGERERLARLGGHDLARLPAPVAEKLGDRAYDVSPLDRGARTPFGLRLARGRDGGGRVVGAGPGNAAEALAVGRPFPVEPFPARCRPLLAGNEVRHLGGDHQADQPPSTTRFAPVT
jgi:hypothetical protein